MYATPAEYLADVVQQLPLQAAILFIFPLILGQEFTPNYQTSAREKHFSPEWE